VKAAFYGTPALAVPILAAVASVAEVALVTTNPDRARGRSRRPHPSPVKEAATAFGFPLSQPARPSAEVDRLREIAPDVAVVAAYGQLITPELLEVPTAGFVNVHFSLLPRWRGASPVVRAILAGDTIAGVTIMQMDRGWDTGPMIATAEIPLTGTETGGSLSAALAALGARLLTECLPGYVSGEIVARPQPEEGATAAAMIRVEEAYVDPGRHSGAAVLRAIRAFDPMPGAWSTLDGDRLKLWRARATTVPAPEPGTAVTADGVVVLGTRDGAVELLEVQPAGKPRMSAPAWMRGRRGEPARLGS
jgi:methionyl-tRNA formyltransferase